MRALHRFGCVAELEGTCPCWQTRKLILKTRFLLRAMYGQGLSVSVRAFVADTTAGFFLGDGAGVPF